MSVYIACVLSAFLHNLEGRARFSYCFLPALLLRDMPYGLSRSYLIVKVQGPRSMAVVGQKIMNHYVFIPKMSSNWKNS